LPAFRRALEPSNVPARPVQFLDLWEQADRHRGEVVRISGRFARRFHQPAHDGFPALTELWLSTPPGNLFCLVFPTPDAEVKPSNETLEFQGTFLRLLRYSSGDGPRLAPLIVGPNPPGVLSTSTPEAPISWVFWGLGVLGMAAVGLAFAFLHLRTPPPLRRRTRVAIEPVDEPATSRTPLEPLDEPPGAGENA
ncbi:MAG TPA: hypothetical protein VFT74_17090, partial [Isosphaeraceae bacterium]|nr:hypothetical protein [Isosphaeraceae bacterium]